MGGKSVFGLLEMGSEIPWNTVERSIFSAVATARAELWTAWGHPVYQTNLMHSGRNAERLICDIKW